MARIGYTWNEEYRKQFYASEKVQEHLAEFIEQAKLPKSPEHREKMSQAKRGRKYSEEHKARMAETQKFRQSLKKQIAEKNPDLPAEQVWTLVRETIENGNN